MNPEIKELWLAALRSGDYVQGVGLLKYTGYRGTKHCCLGVLCELAVQAGVAEQFTVFKDATSTSYGFGSHENESAEAYPPVEVVEWAGLDGYRGDLPVPVESEGAGAAQYSTLVSLNDDPSREFTFQDIANIIEEQF